MINGLHHISIIVSSEESIRFYERLGFKEFSRKERSYDTVVFMEGHGFELVMFVDPKHPPRSMNPEEIGIRCFALQVDDLEEAAKTFECGCIRTDWQGEKYCFVKDPDGLLIELHE